MRFIENGPNLPVEILQAQEDGELVFFCGAGISMRAGLPSFRELVEKLYTALGTTRSTEEEREWVARNYDRVLNHLERRFPVGRLRSETDAILATPPNPDLATHAALIELAKDRSGVARLVTTNFDKLFQEVDPSLPTTWAPLLPVPKPHKWNALVHLHGCLSNAGRNGQHLVLTSADFGTAYLVERWASRFVSELFNHFHVLFVGYGVDDPVMRYLVDSLAAERAADARIRKAYALVGCSPGNEDTERQKWLAKGITPIIYDSQGRHRLLHESLETWSEVWRRGLTSKRNLVLTLGPQHPEGIPDEDISQLCWAVAHRSGSIARVFASLGTSAPLGWLRVFQDRHLLNRPSEPEGGVRVPLVDDGTNTHRPPDLDPVTHELGVWLTSHLASREFLDWSIQAGGRFHPAIAQRIALALSSDHGTRSGVSWPTRHGRIYVPLTVFDGVVARSAKCNVWVGNANSMPSSAKRLYNARLMLCWVSAYTA